MVNTTSAAWALKLIRYPRHRIERIGGVGQQCCVPRRRRGSRRCTFHRLHLLIRDFHSFNVVPYRAKYASPQQNCAVLASLWQASVRPMRTRRTLFQLYARPAESNFSQCTLLQKRAVRPDFSSPLASEEQSGENATELGPPSVKTFPHPLDNSKEDSR